MSWQQNFTNGIAELDCLLPAFIIFLVITGIVLQHSDDLDLPSKHLASSWLLNYYGIKPNPITTYQLGNQTISHCWKTFFIYLENRSQRMLKNYLAPLTKMIKLLSLLINRYSSLIMKAILLMKLLNLMV